MSRSEPARVWIDGRLVAAGEPAVSVTDHGLVAGDGVFEACKVTVHGPFALSRHLRRLDRSAAALGLPRPDHGRIRDAVAAVLEGRAWALGRLRITYTGGDGPLGSQAAYGAPTLIVAVAPDEPPPTVTRVVTTPWRRNEAGAMTGVKTTSYGENVRGLAYAHAHDAAEGLFVNTSGNLCEGTGSNVFCVFGEEVVTPPLSAGPLAGITRELLCAWWPVVERDLSLAEAQAADEVFVTSSLRDVQAVEAWDGHRYAAPGPMTARVAARFAERSGADPDP